MPTRCRVFYPSFAGLGRFRSRNGNALFRKKTRLLCEADNISGPLAAHVVTARFVIPVTDEAREFLEFYKYILFNFPDAQSRVA